MNIHISSITLKGAREKNEDRILLGEEIIKDGRKDLDIYISENGSYIIALADGMGGHKAGDVAAEMLLELLRNEILNLPPDLSESELIEEINKLAQNAHNYLLEESKKKPELEKMGTTLIAVLFYNNLAYFFNAGDSRLYRFRDGYLARLSKDHSVKALTGLPSHALLNSFGAGKTVFIDLSKLKLFENDILLLCSDGLTDTLTDDEIEKILGLSQDPLKDLVTAAFERGSEDNISLIIIYIKN